MTTTPPPTESTPPPTVSTLPPTPTAVTTVTPTTTATIPSNSNASGSGVQNGVSILVVVCGGFTYISNFYLILGSNCCCSIRIL